MLDKRTGFAEAAEMTRRALFAMATAVAVQAQQSLFSFRTTRAAWPRCGRRPGAYAEPSYRFGAYSAHSVKGRSAHARKAFQCSSSHVELASITSNLPHFHSWC